MSKQSKKTFSDNLSSIFEHTIYEDNVLDNPNHLNKNTRISVNELPVTEVAADEKVNERKKLNRKSFSDGLESFFKETINEAIGNSGTVTEVKRGIKKNGPAKVTGIEILLQRTVSKDQIDDDRSERNSKTKRITFVLDTEKVELLKSIARKEKKQIKQIISSLVEDFLQEDEI
jgi:hypothetical protein